MHQDVQSFDHMRSSTIALVPYLGAGEIARTVGDTFGLRTWVEYGFKHAKDDLGWADYRLTDYASIERWWELVMSAYTLVSLQALADDAASADSASAEAAPVIPAPISEHPARDTRSGWKHHLNNLRLLLQPYVCACLLLPWLPLLPHPHVQAVQAGFAALASLVNTFRLVLPT